MSDLLISEKDARKASEILTERSTYYDFGDVDSRGKRRQAQEEKRMALIKALLPAPDGTARTATRLVALEALYCAARAYFDAPDGDTCDAVLKAIQAVEEV